jgi:hypothetical protein
MCVTPAAAASTVERRWLAQLAEDRHTTTAAAAVVLWVHQVCLAVTVVTCPGRHQGALLLVGHRLLPLLLN